MSALNPFSRNSSKLAPFMKARRLLNLALSALLLAFAGCSKPADPAAAGGAQDSKSAAGKKKKLAYVTNGVDPFWNTAAAGVRAAEKEFGVECEVLMPPKGAVDQKRMIEGLLARGIDGVAIS